MSVCTLLVNYRNAPDIAAAVASVMRDDPGAEVLVVDNSDNDQAWAELNALLPLSTRKLRAAGNLGFGGGCNFGVAHTDADFIFLVNPDVRLFPGCTQTLLQCMKDDASIAAASPVQFLDERCQWRLPPSWLPTRIRAWASERALKEPEIASRISAATSAENRRFWAARTINFQRALSGAAMMVRRSALLPGEPLFDPRYFMYFEDTDLCMRLRRKNWLLASVPSALAVHAWRNQPHKQAMMENSADLYFNKFFPLATSWASHRASTRSMCADAKPNVFLRFPKDGLRLPAHWDDEWLMELSPSPSIYPAIAMAGRGPMVPEPVEALAHFENTAVYGRLTRYPQLPPSPLHADPSSLFMWPEQSTS